MNRETTPPDQQRACSVCEEYRDARAFVQRKDNLFVCLQCAEKLRRQAQDRAQMQFFDVQESLF